MAAKEDLEILFSLPENKTAWAERVVAVITELVDERIQHFVGREIIKNARHARNNKMEHLMVDLETWGTDVGCMIRSIGAIPFDLWGKHATSKERGALEDRPFFYANIADDSGFALGLVKEPKTEKWWSDQNPSAQALLKQNQRHIYDVLSHFARFYEQHGVKYIWSRGNQFDISILLHAFKVCGLVAPWTTYHRSVMDTRPIYLVMGEPQVEYDGIPHYALDDSEREILKLQKAVSQWKAQRPE